MSPGETNHLRGPILRSVSRSFYLSLRTLPRTLRDPLSLAYLLARATDTIADTPEPSIEVRRESLRDLASSIQGSASPEIVARIRKSFSSLQKNEAERDLIESLPAILEWLAGIDDRDRSEVRNVLQQINRGQTLDLERFGSGAGVRALMRATELDEYTYLVAGCVGEFWTRVCFGHIRNFSSLSESEMLSLGVEYGKGLQLINILRDVGTDLRNGRCYLPAEELHAVGISPEEILAKPERVEPVMQQWREKAAAGLKGGLEYSCAIRSRRIRFATVLPALIGARTLALLRDAHPFVFARTVKVPRSEIRTIISSVALNLVSLSALRRMFKRLS